LTRTSDDKFRARAQHCARLIEEFMDGGESRGGGYLLKGGGSCVASRPRTPGVRKVREFRGWRGLLGIPGCGTLQQARLLCGTGACRLRRKRGGRILTARGANVRMRVACRGGGGLRITPQPLSGLFVNSRWLGSRRSASFRLDAAIAEARARYAGGLARGISRLASTSTRISLRRSDLYKEVIVHPC